MQFEFYNPTQLIFGAGKLAKLGETVKQYGKKTLIVTGGVRSVLLKSQIATSILWKKSL